MRTLTKIEDAEILAMIRRAPDDWKPAWQHLWLAHREAAKKVMAGWETDELEQDIIFEKSLMDFRRKVLDGSFREKSSVRTFLISICKWRCWQQHKRKNYRLVNLTEELQNHVEERADSDMDVLQDLYTQEEEAVVRRIIDNINADCQRLFREYDWQQLSQKEMAARREIKGQSTIKNKLLKCRKKMEALLRNDREAMELLDRKIEAKDKIRP